MKTLHPVASISGDRKLAIANLASNVIACIDVYDYILINDGVFKEFVSTN